VFDNDGWSFVDECLARKLVGSNGSADGYFRVSVNTSKLRRYHAMLIWRHIRLPKVVVMTSKY
jgi:hypothetical protein